MIIALWIIAVCEVIRAVQNILQLRMISHDNGARDNAYAEFVKSLKSSDKEFVKRMLEEFDKESADDEPEWVQCLNCGHHKAERPCEVYCNLLCKWVNEKDYCRGFEPGRTMDEFMYGQEGSPEDGSM